MEKSFAVELLGGRNFEVQANPGSGLNQFDVAFFAASCDDAATNTKFAQSLKLDYPILSDPDKQAAAAYGVVRDDRPFPERWTFYVGKDGKILAIDKQVKSATHGADIAARLSELGVPRKP